MISNVKLIKMEANPASIKSKVFAHLSKHLKQEVEKQLQKERRWSNTESVTLFIRINSIRLRKNFAVLLLSPLAGNDEVKIKVWITKNGKVTGSDILSSRLESGGSYSTLTNQRRLELLADQLARKLVKRL